MEYEKFSICLKYSLRLLINNLINNFNEYIDNEREGQIPQVKNANAYLGGGDYHFYQFPHLVNWVTDFKDSICKN